MENMVDDMRPKMQAWASGLEHQGRRPQYESPLRPSGIGSLRMTLLEKAGQAPGAVSKQASRLKSIFVAQEDPPPTGNRKPKIQPVSETASFAEDDETEN